MNLNEQAIKTLERKASELVAKGWTKEAAARDAVQALKAHNPNAVAVLAAYALSL